MLQYDKNRQPFWDRIRFFITVTPKGSLNICITLLNLCIYEELEFGKSALIGLSTEL